MNGLKNQHNQLLDIYLLEYLISKTIFNDPTNGCNVKGKRSDWIGLPLSKSLFYAPPGKGLPIGNLTSQIFSNIYLNELDHFVKRQLKIKYYGRYVDDFFLVHPDRDYLKQCIWWISEFIEQRLMLSLNPKKIYLQHYSKGVKFCGVIVKSHRTYVDNRIVHRFRKVLASGIDPGEEESILKSYQSSITSYLGMLEHHNSYNLTRKMGFQTFQN